MKKKGQCLENIRMEEMRDLAHYFGRTAFQKEVAEQYEAIINRWSQELFEKVIQHIRNNEHITDFPKPFEMDRIGKKMNYEVRQGRPEYTGCEYCDDTGFIMRDGYNYNCKCPTGSVRNKGVSYFDKY